MKWTLSPIFGFTLKSQKEEALKVLYNWILKNNAVNAVLLTITWCI